MSKAERYRVGSFVIRVARVFAGSMVLLAILSANIPSSAVNSTAVCQLSCCAGKAPHAAGSCMTESCSAFGGDHAHQSPTLQETEPKETEKLCGLEFLVKNLTQSRFASSGYADASSESSKKDSHEGSVSTAALTKPCQSDCGSCASGFARSGQHRNAVLAYADQPRPPSRIGFGNIDYGRARKLSALCRRGAPRGPPLSFS